MSTRRFAVIAMVLLIPTSGTFAWCDGCGACRPSLRQSLMTSRDVAVIEHKKLRNRCSTN
jgi:hypothetical protein